MNSYEMLKSSPQEEYLPTRQEALNALKRLLETYKAVSRIPSDDRLTFASEMLHRQFDHARQEARDLLERMEWAVRRHSHGKPYTMATALRAVLEESWPSAVAARAAVRESLIAACIGTQREWKMPRIEEFLQRTHADARIEQMFSQKPTPVF